MDETKAKANNPADEYAGRYKDAAAGKSAGELFGTDVNPVSDDAPSVKNLRSAGAGAGASGAG